MNKNPINCDVCGQFISYESLENGTAYHDMVTPDSEVSSETWESLCKKHFKPKNNEQIHDTIQPNNP